MGKKLRIIYLAGGYLAHFDDLMGKKYCMTKFDNRGSQIKTSNGSLGLGNASHQLTLTVEKGFSSLGALVALSHFFFQEDTE